MNIFYVTRVSVVVGLLLGLVAGARADLPVGGPPYLQVRPALLRRPSIIFIQCHGLGYGDLSCYGQTNFQTPNLDKLAAGGMRFTHYSPGSTNTAILQAALLNGNNGPDGSSVAELLHNVGYRTALIGEWTLPGEPWKQGFERFLGYLNPDDAANYYADYFFHYTPQFYFSPAQHQWVPWKPEYGPNEGGREMIYDNTAGKKGKYMPDLMLAGWAQNFIHNYQPDKFNRFRPLFLMVNLPAPRSADPARDVFPVPSDAPYSEESWPQAARNRAAMITRIDGDIGRLLQQIGSFGLSNDVAIFFTSSCVPEKFADPGLNFFRTPADLQSAGNNDWTAPMIVYWPGKISAGQVSDFHWSAQDFLPTAAQIGLARFPDNLPGHSILPVLLGRATPSQP
jgi:arylsulfatase A-like enzyme